MTKGRRTVWTVEKMELSSADETVVLKASGMVDSLANVTASTKAPL